jgi:uncharacterized protein
VAASNTSRTKGVLGFVAGIVIGAAAGMSGVGGGEFRIPVLLHVLRLPIHAAAGANCVIGLLVVVLGVVRRWGQTQFSYEDLLLAAIMAACSLIGAVAGARMAHRIPIKPLKLLVCIYLLLVGIWMFGLPIKEAGTLSLLVSIPTVAAGAFTYRRLGHIPNGLLALAAIMGAGSIIGVLVGAALLPFIDKHALKAILGGLLLLATLCLSLPWLREVTDQT